MPFHFLQVSSIFVDGPSRISHFSNWVFTIFCDNNSSSSQVPWNSSLRPAIRSANLCWSTLAWSFAQLRSFSMWNFDFPVSDGHISRNRPFRAYEGFFQYGQKRGSSVIRWHFIFSKFHRFSSTDLREFRIFPIACSPHSVTTLLLTVKFHENPVWDQLSGARINADHR